MGLPRLNTPDLIHSVTNRTEHAAYFLRPCPKVNGIIKYWMARAVATVAPDIEIFAFCFLSNHFHMLVRDPKGQLARFMNYFQGNLATRMNAELGRKGHFFSDTYTDIIVDGEYEFWDRYCYTALNAVSTNLVGKHHQWTGVSSVAYALQHKPIIGSGTDYTRYNEQRRMGKKPAKKKFKKTYAFNLATPPMLRSKTPKEQTTFLKHQIANATNAYRKKHNNAPPLGMKAVKARSPHTVPEKAKKSPKPRFFCYCKKRRKKLNHRYRKFVHKYRLCIDSFQHRISKQKKKSNDRAHVRQGEKQFWPAGCYPPTSHITIEAY